MSRSSVTRQHQPVRPAPAAAHDELVLRRKAAFQAAVRHSGRVYLLRRILPVLAATSLVLVGLWLWFDPLRYIRDLPVQLGTLKISGTKLTMEAPKLTGFSKDGQPYTITAESAAQDLTKASVIELTDIVGKFSASGQGEMVLTAKDGIYDSKQGQMRLFNGIEIKSADDYTGKLSEAVGEPKKGHLISNKPVEIIFSDGNLTSNRMEVFDHGKVIVFEDKVVLNMRNVGMKKGWGDDDSTASTAAKKK